jgi:hypothetical protein
MLDDLLATPEEYLARAAQHDLERARGLIGELSSPRLLEVVLSQGALAVEPGRVRPAGIDALAELDRAAVELMGLPQGITSTAENTQGHGAGVAPGMAPPLLTGWELITVADRSELIGATTSLPARPWHLALIAFADEPLDPADPSSATLRELTAASTDGRLVTATLRFGRDEPEPAILASRVTTRLEDLGRSAPLAWGLRAVLGSTADVTPAA